MNEPTDWTFTEKPVKPGWYATLHCWDAQEGIFPGSNYWDGEYWDESLPFTAYAGPFDDERSAEQWADDHDVEA